MFGQGDLYTELKGWQAALGSAFGFIALLIGALWNYHLNRRRDAKLRQEEISSIAAALYGEILLIRVAVARMADHFSQRCLDLGVGRTKRRVDQYFVADHRIPEATLYEALSSKIGLLQPDLVISIISFHRDASEARNWLEKMVEDPDRGYNYSPLYVLQPAKGAVLLIIPTLRRLERIAGIKRPAKDPDLGKANEVIELELDAHNLQQ